MVRRAAAAGILIGLAACGGSDGPVGGEIPEGWEVHGSSELGYRMAYPPDWAVRFDEENSEDVFAGADAEEIRVARYLDENGWPADIIFNDAMLDFEDDYGARPVLVEQLELSDGTRVQVYQHNVPTADGVDVTQRAVILAAPDMWYVDWHSETDEPSGPRERLLEIVRSFVPLPLLPDGDPA
jgi:hypothetical protein